MAFLWMSMSGMLLLPSVGPEAPKAASQHRAQSQQHVKILTTVQPSALLKMAFSRCCRRLACNYPRKWPLLLQAPDLHLSSSSLDLTVWTKVVFQMPHLRRLSLGQLDSRLQNAHPLPKRLRQCSTDTDRWVASTGMVMMCS